MRFIFCNLWSQCFCYTHVCTQWFAAKRTKPWHVFILNPTLSFSFEYSLFSDCLPSCSLTTHFSSSLQSILLHAWLKLHKQMTDLFFIRFEIIFVCWSHEEMKCIDNQSLCGNVLIASRTGETYRHWSRLCLHIWGRIWLLWWDCSFRMWDNDSWKWVGYSYRKLQMEVLLSSVRSRVSPSRISLRVGPATPVSDCHSLDVLFPAVVVDGRIKWDWCFAKGHTAVVNGNT